VNEPDSLGHDDLEGARDHADERDGDADDAEQDR
jgi:hypothetical protein